MNNAPLNPDPNLAPADAVAKLIGQLPLQAQHQVLDFVEFLLHRYQLDPVVQPTHDAPEEDLSLWKVDEDDEDWLALEAQLAAEKNT